MAIETLYATSLVSGTVSTQANALGAPNAVWTTDTGNTSWSARWAIGNPVGTSASGTHAFVARLRKEAGQSGTPSATVNVYSGGTQIGTSGSVNITSTSQDVTVNISSASITNFTDVDIEVITTAAGGSPSARSAVQTDALWWTGDFLSIVSKNATDASILSISESSSVEVPPPIDTSALSISESQTSLIMVSRTDTSVLSIQDQSTVFDPSEKVVDYARGSVGSGLPGVFVSTSDFSSLEIGDLLVCFAWSVNSTSTWSSSGWNLLNSTGGMGMMYRIVDGTEGASFTFVRAVSTTNPAYAVVAQIKDIFESNAIADFDFASSTQFLTLPSVDAASSDSLILQIVGTNTTGGATWTPPSGTVERFEDTSSTSIAIARDLVSSGPSGTREWTLSTGGAATRGGILAINVTDPSTSVTPIASTDTSSLSITDTSSLLKTSTVNDTSSLSINESRSAMVTLSRSDSATLAITESQSRASSFSKSDVSSLAISETSMISVTRSSSDSASLSVSESTTRAVSLNRIDTSSLSINETKAIAKSSNRADTASISISESTQKVVVTFVNSSDASSVAVSESSTRTLTQPVAGTDASVIALSEQSSLFKTISASDSDTLSISESRNAFVNLSQSDDNSLNISEARSIVNSLSSTDEHALHVSETKTLASESETDDIAAVSLEESSQVSLDKNSIDSDTLSLTENSTVQDVSLGSNAYVFDGGIWKNGTIFIYQDGQWKPTNINIRTGGQWI